MKIPVKISIGDKIQFGIFIVMLICALAGFAAWADGRYAHQDTVMTMQSQISQIYEKLIPQAERK